MKTLLDDKHSGKNQSKLFIEEKNRANKEELFLFRIEEDSDGGMCNHFLYIKHTMILTL